MQKFSLLIFSILLLGPATYAEENAKWVFFDLGKTVLDHGAYNSDISSFEDQRYMTGSRELLQDLLDDGYNIGLIIDIPEEWGNTYETKFTTLKTFVASGWSDANYPEFEWQLFTHILLPLNNTERKSTNNTILFERALELANVTSAIYIGENINEMPLAESVNMKTIHYDGVEGNFPTLERVKELGNVTP